MSEVTCKGFAPNFSFRVLNFAFHISYTASALILAVKQRERVTMFFSQFFLRYAETFPRQEKEFSSFSLSKSPEIIGDQVHVTNLLPRRCSRREQTTSFKMIDAVERHMNCVYIFHVKHLWTSLHTCTSVRCFSNHVTRKDFQIVLQL